MTAREWVVVGFGLMWVSILIRSQFTSRNPSGVVIFIGMFIMILGCAIGSHWWGG